MISPSQNGEIFVWPLHKPPSAESGIFGDKNTRNDYFETFVHPGQQNRAPQANAQSERCVIALFAPAEILRDFRNKIKAGDASKWIHRVIITINFEGALAVLVDLERISPAETAQENEQFFDQNII